MNTTHTHSAGSLDDAAVRSSDRHTLAIAHARQLYTELEVTHSCPALFGFRGDQVRVLMPLPFNDPLAKKWAVEAEAVCFLQNAVCDWAAIVYPVCIRSTKADGKPHGHLVTGLLVVTHEANRPDRQAFLPIIGRAGDLNLIGEAVDCTGISQGITYPNLLTDPARN